MSGQDCVNDITAGPLGQQPGFCVCVFSLVVAMLETVV